MKVKIKTRIKPKIGDVLNNSGVALYLFANGILGFNNRGEFRTLANTIFSGNFIGVVMVVLSLSAILAGIFLLLALFKVDVPITDFVLLIFICIWIAFIVIVDIIHPISISRPPEFLPYLLQLAAHLMALGGLVSATKRFNK